ncbi:MAG: FtsX-like permease family protein [Ruminococcaceae bacterium]|nr:FtsX-like permease family protein [Oscillospiraceae bacterium]
MAKYSRLRRLRRSISLIAKSIRAVFYPRNIKSSFKTILFSAKEYTCFFIALFVVQTGFLTISLMTDINLAHAQKTVQNEYNHHIEVVGLNQEQKVNLEYIIDLAVTRLNPYVQSASFYEESDGVYVAKIVLNEDQRLSAGFSHFKREMLSNISQEGWIIRRTPLYTYHQDYIIPYHAAFWGLTLLWMLLSVVILWFLYRIRVNHFKFTYGIYMACGADFSKLYGTAGGELLAISCMTILPSILIGTGLTAGLYLRQNIPLAVSVRSILGFFIFNLLAVLLAVYFPMRRMAKKPPVTLLRAVDNGSLVVSPNRSFRMFGEGYPHKYELFGMWRLRKYYAGLMLSAVLFAALFVSGLYMLGLEQAHDAIDPYEYVIRYGTLKPVDEEEAETDENGEWIPPTPMYDEEEINLIRDDLDIFLEDVYAIPGVSYVDWRVSTSGGSTQSHLLLKPGQISGGSVSLVSSEERASEGYKRAMNDYDYVAIDQLYIDTLVNHNLCTIEGDPYRLLAEEKMVIVSEDVNNQKCYHFSPGDKILVAVFKASHGALEMNFNPKDLLRQQIKKNDFTYEEYTVCAVIRGQSSERNITFGVTFDDYKALAKESALRDTLKVYMEDGTDYDVVRAAEGKIRQAISVCSGWLVEPTGHYFETHIEGMKQDDGLIFILSLLLLLISPLVWFFSQVMYYRKRRKEFHLLYALGAPRNSIAKLHRLAGGVLSGIAFLATAMLSYLCNWLMHMLLNTLLPKFGIIENVYYAFEISWPAFALCLVISVLCGFLSCEVPYVMFRQEQKKNPDRIIVNG